MLEELIGLPWFLTFSSAFSLIWWRVSLSRQRRPYGIAQTVDDESRVSLGRTEIHVYLHQALETSPLTNHSKRGTWAAAGEGRGSVYDQYRAVG